MYCSAELPSWSAGLEHLEVAKTKGSPDILLFKMRFDKTGEDMTMSYYREYVDTPVLVRIDKLAIGISKLTHSSGSDFAVSIPSSERVEKMLHELEVPVN